MYIISRATMQRVTLPPRLHDVIAAAMMIELFVLGSNTNRASRVICSLDPPAIQISLYIFTYLIKIVYLCTY